jgi:hypothetical protein
MGGNSDAFEGIARLETHWNRTMPNEKLDFGIIVAGLILGSIFGLLVGVPLWLVTGYPQYLRLSFFGGVLLGGILGTTITSEKRRRRRKG